MIFPFLRGFVAPHLAPITYFLLAINVFVFLGTLEDFDRADQHIDVLLADHQFLSTQGYAFAVMIEREVKPFSGTLQALAKQVLRGDNELRVVLGGFALRNTTFMQRADAYPFDGDAIAMADWRKKFLDLKDTQAEHPSYLWGISELHNGWQQWISYQFSHSGFLHLFWNMVFLLIFGTFVESQLGSSFVILTYLGGGIAGAYSYAELSGVSWSPLVGASAAVSGLMGLVGVHWLNKERLNFFYWLMPMRGYFGFVLLPSWIVISVSLLPDLSGYLAASHDFGSVAYAAHLGGAGWGAVMAGFIAIGMMKKEVDETRSQAPSDHSRWAA